MISMEKIDRNFIVETTIDQPGIKFYNAEEDPFRIYGIMREQGRKCFVRLPSEVAARVNTGVDRLNLTTAGGRLRFITDSPYVAINCNLSDISRTNPHWTVAAAAGFDMYADGVYAKTFSPPYNVTSGYESIARFEDRKLRSITINFPYYASVNELYIGLDEKSSVLPPRDYTISRPVVFYGSSITLGACASRPGTSYESILERRFDFDFINLGFSGSAKAEPEIAEYISGLDMSLLVYDYDYNSPSLEYLEETHERMFLTIRNAQPELPVIMMSRPQYVQTAGSIQRAEIIERTYKNALARGDKNVYFINGRELMSLVEDNGLVDGIHPSDSGFFSMAKRLGDEIEKNYDRIFQK